jgi:acyl-CoA thioesterase I
VQKPARQSPFSRCVGAGRLNWLAAASVAVLTVLSPAYADECPSLASGFEANGAAFAVPKGGAGRILDILAIGSSSTFGVGATAPDRAYPAQLESELIHEDGIAAEVKNAGVSGETAAKTLPRLLGELKGGWARLVIWQVGTNDAIVGVDETAFRATVEKGVAAARAAGVPLMLMDPQYTVKSPDQARYERFVAIVDDVGARAHVPVLSRFAMMKRRGSKAAQALLSPDGLHMNDQGYQCVAHAIADVIETAVGAKNDDRAGAKL